jgi:hypothetical protein
MRGYSRSVLIFPVAMLQAGNMPTHGCSANGRKPEITIGLLFASKDTLKAVCPYQLMRIAEPGRSPMTERVHHKYLPKCFVEMPADLLYWKI